jgi:adenosine/AMP kinase
MARFLRTSKETRPKTTVKGKRYLCAVCRRRSPKPVKTPAPWHCPICLKQKEQAAILGVVDGFSPKGIEDKGEIKWR